jgi:hypothetical protein
MSLCVPLTYDVIYCHGMRQQFYGIFKSMILTPGFRSEDFERLKEEHLNYISKQYVTSLLITASGPRASDSCFRMR